MVKADFNWLPTSMLKGVTLPKIIREEHTGKYDGYYTLGNNTIVVANEDEKLEAATIAHEFRHHLQYHRYGDWTPLGWGTNSTLSYKQQIHMYFITQIHEYDALLFEHKYAPNFLNDWWLNKLVNPKELSPFSRKLRNIRHRIG